MVRDLQRSSSKDHGKHTLGKEKPWRIQYNWVQNNTDKPGMRKNKPSAAESKNKDNLQKCSYNWVVDWAAKRNCSWLGKFCQTFNGQERQHFGLPGSLFSQIVGLCRSGHKQMAPGPFGQNICYPWQQKYWPICNQAVPLVEFQSTELCCCYSECSLKANTSQCTLVLVPHLLTAFTVSEILAASSNCGSQLTFLSFSCWLFFQLWKSVQPVSFVPHLCVCILLGRTPCWHLCWVCFIQLFSTPVCTKAVSNSHLSFWCLYIPLLFWVILALWPPAQSESWQVFAAFIWGIFLLSSAKLPWRFLSGLQEIFIWITPTNVLSLRKKWENFH